jgi:LacI family transcriptional regulator
VRGGRLAAQHLLESGRRRIAFIGGPRGLTQIKHRLHAAQEEVDAVDGARLRFVETGTMDADAGRRGAEDLLAGPDRPDAIFAANDLVALGVLQALTLAGVRVPEDVAIIGFDDIDFAASAAIPLSSVRQPRAEMGRAAIDLLLAAIDDPAAQARDIVLEPELVVRRSTG